MKTMISFLSILSLFGSFAQASVKDDIFFSGDVRGKVSSYNYKTEDFSLTDNVFKVEVCGKADYYYENLWANAELKMIHTLAKDTEKTSLELEKALIGYEVATDVSILLGRMPFDNEFNSKIQYGSKFNGISLNGACEIIPFIKRATLHGGPFIVSQGEDNCAFVGELDLLADSLPLSLSYSLTCWNHQKTANDMVGKFMISQVAASYSLTEVIGSQDMGFFTGFLKNHGIDHSNKGWYVGSKIGIEKPSLPKQWNISLSYQNVQENSIPQHDLNGAGKKSASKGFVLESVYAVNTHLSFKTKAESSQGTHTSFKTKGLEISAICKF